MSNQGGHQMQLKAYKRVAGKTEIHRFVLESLNEGCYVQLLGKLSNAYKTNQDLHVFWQDVDGDFIAISSDDDLQVAINSAKDGITKLYLVDATGRHISDEFGGASTTTTVTMKQSEPAAESVKPQETRPSSGSGEHHPFVVCDGCNSAISGRRFKCVECRNYDLCERCELGNQHPEHNMLLIRRSGSRGCPYQRGGSCNNRLPPQVILGMRGRGPRFPMGWGLFGNEYPCGGPCDPTCKRRAPSSQAAEAPTDSKRATADNNGTEKMQTESTSQGQPSGSERTDGRFESEKRILEEMGFGNESGWLEELLIANAGEVSRVLDLLMGCNISGHN